MVLSLTGNKNITDEQIRQYMSQAKSADEIYAAAQKHGVSADQIRGAVAPVAGAVEKVDAYLAGRVRPPEQPLAYQAPTPPKAAFTPAEFTPAVRDPVEGTVAGNLEQVLDPNSPLMQRAATMGQQLANQRGLLNSSIGISAAMNPMVEAGLQIATPDAASSNQFALANMQERNLTGRFNAEQGLKADMFNADLFAQTGRFNVGQANEILARTMDHAQQTRMAEITNKYQAQLQNSSDFNRAYQNMVQNIAAIEADPNMSPEAKQSAINNQVELMSQFGSITKALSDSGLAQSFGNLTGGTAPGTAPDGTTGGLTPPGGTGTTSLWTQQPLGPIPGANPYQPDRFGTLTGTISTDAARILQDTYGIDPRFVVEHVLTPGEMQQSLNNLRDPDIQRRLNLQNAITAALREGTVYNIPLTDPQFGEWYSPELRRDGSITRPLVYDPDNVLGLR